MENLGYLIAAYLIIWVGLFGYLFWMSGVLRSIRSEVAALKAQLPLEVEQTADDLLAAQSEAGSR